jgi:MinD superfamily P-loop ATPase containing an inserted ferredoxin domain
MKKLLILSGKGGTGKTTVAAAFIDLLSARAFADCDVDAPNLHLVAGITGKPKLRDFHGSQKAVIDAEKCIGCGICLSHCRFDAILHRDGKCKVNEFACEGCGVCQYVCPRNIVSMQNDIAGEQTLYCGDRCFSTAKLKMGRGNSGKLVTEIKNALYKAAETELAIIDGSPGVGCPVIASLSGVNMVLIVAEPSLSGISDMKRILKTAQIFMVKTAVCINKYDVAPDKAAAIKNYCDQNAISFVGYIPYDKATAKAINAGHSLAVVDCPAGKAIKAVLKNSIQLLNA